MVNSVAAPVVNNDGHHPTLMKSGGVFLSQGLQPFRLSWFNGVSGSTLKLEYEGPGIRRQKVPPTAFWRRPPGTTNQTELQRGLAFEAYVEDSWQALADFVGLKPAAVGVAADLDLKHRARQDNTGLVFSGYLEISTPGVYAFHLESDDGADLYVGEPAAACEVVALKGKSVPAVRRLEEALAEPASPQWVEIEGQVVFAGHNESGLELELTARGERWRATVQSR